jgi:hypothetical protein
VVTPRLATDSAIGKASLVKNWILCAVGALLAADNFAVAQAPPAPAPVQCASPAWEPSTSIGLLSLDGGPAAPCVWASGEYLVWWVKNGPGTPPLLTTSSAPDAMNAGAIGADGTRILIGDHSLDYGTFSGVRLNLGGWLDGEGMFGVEGSGFLLERRTTGAGATSDGPTTFFTPAVEVVPPLGNVAFIFPATGPGLLTTARLTSQSRLWGAEANLAVNVLRNSCWSVDLLGGFRYADLEENLLYDTKSAVVGDPGTNLTTSDFYGTQNRFYGGQFGARFGYQQGRLFANAAARLALGGTHESIAITGSTLSTTSEGTMPLAVGGIYTGPSNMGRVTQDRFAVLPEVRVSAGAQVTSRLRAFVGYDFFYCSDVVRPGSQVDTRVDFQNTRPTVPVNPRATTDFWAQGINFGLELRY